MNSYRYICILLGIIFVILGILNIVLVHPVPGIFYLILSVIYFPPTDKFSKSKFGLVIPLILKLIIALVILWGTLAVGDLAEILGL